MKKQSPLKRIFAIRGMGGALTAFAGLIIIYIAFGIINPAVFSGQNVMNLLPVSYTHLTLPTNSLV